MRFCTPPLFFLMDNRNIIVFRCIFITHFRRTIRRTIVHKNDLYISIGLIYYAFNAVLEIISNIASLMFQTVGFIFISTAVFENVF